MTPINEDIPVGICQCGCGRNTELARRTCKRYGWKKGQPFRFVMGHGGFNAERNKVYAEKRKTGEDRICPTCGKTFYVRPSYSRLGRMKYCSVVCSSPARKVPRPYQRRPLPELTCKGCGKVFSRKWPIAKRQKVKGQAFCSRECFSTYNVGENNSIYRGQRKDDRGPRWNKIAEEIRIRDERKCMACSKSEAGFKQRFPVDHIVPYRMMLAFEIHPNDPINLMTLCHSCHPKKTHIESRLLKGDVIGFLDDMRTILKLDIHQVKMALVYAGMLREGKIVPAKQ